MTSFHDGKGPSFWSLGTEFYDLLKPVSGSDEMVLWIKEPVTKVEDQSSIPGNHMVEGDTGTHKCKQNKIIKTCF